MSAGDWKALGQQVKSTLAMAKHKTLLGYAILLLAVFFVGKCGGKGEGKDDVKNDIAVQEGKAAKKAAKLASDSAEFYKKQSSVLASKLSKADALIKDKGVSFNKATQKYEALRDSVLKAPHDTTTGQLIASADSALKVGIAIISTYKAKDSVSTELIATQAKRIVFLESVGSQRNVQIVALNERLEIASRRIGRARRNGFTVGLVVGAAGTLAAIVAR